MQYIINAIKWLRERLGFWMWVLAPLLIFIEVFLSNLQVIIAGVQELRVQVGNAQEFVVNFPQVEMVWNAARYFFPIEAALALAAIILQLRIIALAIRVVKALVPILWH
jgi:multisubunit Na+/H+ antiporter MnhC subunit